MVVMRVDATDAAQAIVRRARAARSGALTITLGTGCCESTAPFLYEDFWPGSDQERIGQVAGVEVFAPEYLRAMYPGDDGVVIDVYEGPAESMSIETEWDCRLVLRGLGLDLGGAGADETCMVPPAIASAPSATPRRSPADLDVGQRVKGELPEALRRLRVR
jgi:uncharacterized protein (DUF779 family)